MDYLSTPTRQPRTIAPPQTPPRQPRTIAPPQTPPRQPRTIAPPQTPLRTPTRIQQRNRLIRHDIARRNIRNHDRITMAAYNRAMRVINRNIRRNILGGNEYSTPTNIRTSNFKCSGSKVKCCIYFD
jgi:hypothetical protein